MEESATRTIALDPSPRGIGFAVLEGSERLVDWGVARPRASDDESVIIRAEQLLHEHAPAMLVVEGEPRRRGQRASRLIEKVQAMAYERGVWVVTTTYDEVRREFAGSGSTKWEIAIAISRWFPELEHWLPRRRRPWKSEDERMNIFDAAAFALTALRRRGE